MLIKNSFMKKLILKLVFISFSLISVNGFAQPGTLDNTFGTSGKVITDIATGFDIGSSVAVQSDGKIVVAGNGFTGAGNSFSLVRYNVNGTLDNTFGTAGIVTTSAGSGSSGGKSLAIQSDGKIVVAGNSSNGTDIDFTIIRYTTNGTPDPTFGTAGIAITPIGASNDGCLYVAFQTDGKILVSGYNDNGGTNEFALARYTTSGILDVSFGTGGIVTTNIGTLDDIGYSVAVQTDGKIVVGGYTLTGGDYDFALVRYTSSGILDNTFGTNGIIITQVGTNNDRAYSLAIQPDGKIILAGDSYNGTDGDFALVRFNTNGTLDNTFGTSGKVITPIGAATEIIYSVKIQNDGKVLAAGYSSNGLDYDFALVRYNSNGTLDNTFGTSGKVTTPIGFSDEIGYSMAVRSNGKIVVAGYSNNGTNWDFALAQYAGCSPVTFSQTLVNSIGDSVLVGIHVYKLDGTYKDTLVATSGCDSIVTSVLTFVGGIGDAGTVYIPASISPNPSTGIFMLEIPASLHDVKYEIFNILGEQILQYDFGSGADRIISKVIDISAQNQGMFFLNVKSQEGSVIKKIVKMQ